MRLACELGLVAVDHCTYLSDADVDALAASGTTATLLPGVEFSTRSPYPDARRLLDAGVTVALATDCNPGSCYTSSMPLCIALAVREMGMSPAEALSAATAGGARALGRADVGHLGVGASADLVVLDAPSYLHLPTAPASRWSARPSSAAAALSDREPPARVPAPKAPWSTAPAADRDFVRCAHLPQEPRLGSSRSTGAPRRRP